MKPGAIHLVWEPIWEPTALDVGGRLWYVSREVVEIGSGSFA